MDRNEPGTNEVCEVVKGVCVCDTVDGSIYGKEEEEDICYMTKPMSPVSSIFVDIVKKVVLDRKMGCQEEYERGKLTDWLSSESLLRPSTTRRAV